MENYLQTIGEWLLKESGTFKGAPIPNWTIVGILLFALLSTIRFKRKDKKKKNRKEK